LKPVVAVPLWLAGPFYLIYSAVWVALVVLGVAIVALIVIGYGIVAVTRRRPA